MLVYRVESAAGEGAYRTAFCSHEFDARRQPMPFEDARLATAWGSLWSKASHEAYHFGFDSMDSLLAWFYDAEWRVAADRELAISVYELDPEQECATGKSVHLGDKQLVFRRDLATRINTISLSSTTQATH